LGDIVQAWLPSTCCKNAGEDTDSFFCSELVATALRALDLTVDEKLNVSNVLPRNFAGPRRSRGESSGRILWLREHVSYDGRGMRVQLAPAESRP
jgi:hypothetical protein